MLKKTITYTDYNGLERTEDFYFNLTKAEVLDLQLSTAGGYAETVQKIVDTKDHVELMGLFKSLVLRAYGEKSADGRRFMKTAEIAEAFSQTEAYSEIFMELVLNTDAAIAFANGIIPPNMDKTPSAVAPALGS